MTSSSAPDSSSCPECDVEAWANNSFLPEVPLVIEFCHSIGKPSWDAQEPTNYCLIIAEVQKWLYFKYIILHHLKKEPQFSLILLLEI